MKVLLYGSGAREHALADKIRSSELLEELYFAGCESAFCDLDCVIGFDTFEDLAQKAANLKINLLVVGPEEPLASGIVDVFKEFGISAIGPNKYWAQLESSKIFAKDFMYKNGINTAPFKVASSQKEFQDALLDFGCEIPVIKLDGLAGGKGVFVCDSIDEAVTKWCDKKMLLEKKLTGREVSIFSLWDGKTLLSFDGACDFKRLEDDDLGPNTGGMGAFFPFEADVDTYLRKLKKALTDLSADFCGIIYSGLMLVGDEIYVLEYNMRFGDPEIQAVIQNWQNDILEVFDKMINKKLCDVMLKVSKEPSYCVVLASQGYPCNPQIGAPIFNIEEAQKKFGVKIYFAGVKKAENNYYVDGGRVLSICKNAKGALDDIYAAADLIKFDGKIFRHDIKKPTI